MADFDLDSFSNSFAGGARAYLFEWKPVFTLLSNKGYQFLVKSTNVPSTTIEEIIVDYQQINYKVGGKKTFEDWTVSLNVDVDAKVRTDFEKWSDKIHKVKESEGYQHFYPDDTQYMSQETFTMYGLSDIPFGEFDGKLEITLYNTWPKIIGPITLDYGNQDFATFDVTFSYLYHKIKAI